MASPSSPARSAYADSSSSRRLVGGTSISRPSTSSGEKRTEAPESTRACRRRTATAAAGEVMSWWRVSTCGTLPAPTPRGGPGPWRALLTGGLARRSLRPAASAPPRHDEPEGTTVDREATSTQVRLLGDLLGEAISEVEGPDELALVEQVRSLAIASRAGDDQARAEVHELLREVPAEEAMIVVSAFAAWFHLIN